MNSVKFYRKESKLIMESIKTSIRRTGIIGIELRARIHFSELCLCMFVKKIGKWPNIWWSLAWDGLPAENHLVTLTLKLKQSLSWFFQPSLELSNNQLIRSDNWYNKAENVKRSRKEMASSTKLTSSSIRKPDTSNSSDKPREHVRQSWGIWAAPISNNL